jgi:hypothetical protein
MNSFMCSTHVIHCSKRKKNKKETTEEWKGHRAIWTNK